MHYALLLVDGVADAGYAMVFDALRIADRLRPQLKTPIAPLTIELVGAGKAVFTRGGARISTVPIRQASLPHVVVVPAPGTDSAAELEAICSRLAGGPVLRLLVAWAQAGALTATACAGTFVLATAGLVQKKHVTTAWWLADALRSKNCCAQVVATRMLVHDGSVVTAGAFLGHLDLSLWLIKQQSVELSELTARYLVATPGSSQAPYIIPSYTQHTDALIATFEKMTRDRLQKPMTMNLIARQCGVSERTLHRRVKAALGRSPLAQIQEWRMQMALHMLKTSELSVESIAEQVGYTSATVLRTLVRRRLGIGLRAAPITTQ